ncbi:Hypothetical protein A7982_05016 [Minicystis rosea]|nr:Hypothetical protein A7982_05016 [Minicystis rosea]
MSSDSDEVVKKADGEEAEAEAKDEAKADEAEAKSSEDAGEESASKDEAEGEASAKDEPSEAKDEPSEEAPAAAASNVHADAHDGGHGEEPQVEEDRPRNGLIAVTIVTTVVSVVLVLLGIREIFRSAFIDEVQSKVLSHQSSELRDLRAEEKAKLGRYQWVSKKDGVVRIPLDRAISVTLAEYKERAKQAALAPKPAAPKADAPAGSASADAPKHDGDAPKDGTHGDAPKDGAHGDAPKDGAHGDAPKQKQDAPKEH